MGIGQLERVYMCVLVETLDAELYFDYISFLLATGCKRSLP